MYLSCMQSCIVPLNDSEYGIRRHCMSHGFSYCTQCTAAVFTIIRLERVLATVMVESLQHRNRRASFIFVLFLSTLKSHVTSPYNSYINACMLQSLYNNMLYLLSLHVYMKCTCTQSCHCC